MQANCANCGRADDLLESDGGLCARCAHNREAAELNAVYEIRQIIEPEPGNLMLSELVDAVRQMRAERDRLVSERSECCAMLSMITGETSTGTNTKALIEIVGDEYAALHSANEKLRGECERLRAEREYFQSLLPLDSPHHQRSARAAEGGD